MKHLKRIIKAIESGILPNGEISETHVYHDKNCPALKGRINKCCCTPDVEIYTTSGNYRIMVDGTPVKIEKH